MTHDEMIAVIQHHKDGGKVQWQLISASKAEWRDCYNDAFAWDFNQYNYRAKPKPLVLWVAVRENGDVFDASQSKNDVELTMPTSRHNVTLKKFVEVTE
jgi:hypothetical protein